MVLLTGLGTILGAALGMFLFQKNEKAEYIGIPVILCAVLGAVLDTAF